MNKIAKDLVIHFYTNSFRGSITQAKSLTETIRRRCEIKDLKFVEEIHTSISNTLLQSILLKGDERVRTISERSVESFGLTHDYTVYTEKWGKNYIRGFADKLETQALNDKSNFMIGKTLYGATEEYKSIHKISDNQLGLTANDLQVFFNISEQIPSQVYVNSSGWNNENYENNGLAVLFQAMPGFERSFLEDLWNNIKDSLAFKHLHEETLTEQNFKELFNGIDEEIGFVLGDYEFKCNCTKDSVLGFLEKADVSDLQLMKNNEQIICCSHCSEKYVIDPRYIDSLISKAS